MLLGKRPRPPIQRTTSMSQLLDEQPLSGHRRAARRHVEGEESSDGGFLNSMLSPRGGAADGGRVRSNPGEFAAVETAAFLWACRLCRKPIGPGRDLFMYRGDIAFCSLECRQQQMNLDEWKEKCSRTSMMDASSTSTSEKSGGDGPVAAA